MREKFKLKVWELVKEQVTVLYRNCFYQANIQIGEDILY